MILYPRAKINLGLYVQNRRPDGYHDILTYMRDIDYCDILEIQPSDRYGISYSGLSIEGNEFIDELARWLLDKKWMSPLRIHLHKLIPPGSGLGGGSSDLASFARHILENDHFKGNRKDLLDKMKSLSSDSVFFFNEKSAIVTGKGDVIEPFQVDLSGLQLLLLFPSLSISTKAAFDSVHCDSRDLNLFKSDLKNIQQWPIKLSNVFEKPFLQSFPDYDRIKKKLYENGALYVSLSGTGSAFYAIFKQKADIALDDLASRWIAL